MSQLLPNVTDIGPRGQALYERTIQSQVERDNRGKFLILDVESGEYEIDSDDLTASKRLLARMPNALLYGLRIGSPSAYRLGIQREKRVTRC